MTNSKQKRVQKNTCLFQILISNVITQLFGNFHIIYVSIVFFSSIMVSKMAAKNPSSSLVITVGTATKSEFVNLEIQQKSNAKKPWDVENIY